MAKRVLDYDPISRTTTYFDYDHLNDETLITREQDVSSIIEANKALQNDDQASRDGIKNGWWHYAQVPNIVIERWLTEYGVDFYNKDHKKKIFWLLNQPEYRYLKTTTKMHRG